MIHIRKANEADYPVITDLIERAFLPVQHTDFNKYLSLTKTRHSESFIPELSLVAEIDGNKIVGHIHLVRISINYIYPSLGFAQVAVMPEYQELGIGSILVNNAHQRARELGYGSIISLGHKNFLSRFGYSTLINFGIHFPYGIVEEQCLGIELYPGSLMETSGMVNFPLELL